MYRGQTLQVHSSGHMYDNFNGLSRYIPLPKDSWNVQGTDILSSLVLVVLAYNCNGLSLCIPLLMDKDRHTNGHREC